MAGLLDDEEDISIDDLFEKPAEEQKEEVIDPKNNEYEEKLRQQDQELREMKEQMAELKKKQFGSISAQLQQEQSQPARLKDRIKQKLESSNFDIAEAMEFAATEAFNAGQNLTKSQYVPMAAQAARFAISRYLEENPVTASVRKELDGILAKTTDAELASISPENLQGIIESTVDVAEGRVLRKTRNTRGAEPPTYSTGNRGSFGQEKVQTSKPKLTPELKAAVLLAKEQGFTEAEIREMYEL